MVDGIGEGMSDLEVARDLAPVAVATSCELILVNPVSHHRVHRCNKKKTLLILLDLTYIL